MQSSKPNPDMPQMLELPDEKLKITVINMLRALMERVDKM